LQEKIHLEAKKLIYNTIKFILENTMIG